MTRAAVKFSAAHARIRGKTAAEDFTLGLVPSNVPAGSPTLGTATLLDTTYTTETGGTTYFKSDVRVDGPLSLPAPAFSSVSPGVCGVDSAGRVSRVADGLCEVHVRCGGDVRAVRQTISSAPGVLTYTRASSFAAGSLRRHVMDQQLAALSGATPGVATQRTFAAGGGVNAGNVLRRAGVAGYSRPPLDVLDQVLTGGVAGPVPFHPWKAWITPHHFLTWLGHVNGPNTATRRWVFELVVEYSATAWTGALCKLLPANVFTGGKAPALQNSATIGVGINAWARLWNTYRSDGEVCWVQPVELRIGLAYPVGDARRAWQCISPTGPNLANGGDSGSPIFCFINGDLVLLSHAQFQGAVGTMLYSDYIADINAALAVLNGSGSYTVGTVDVSGFTTF